MIITVDDFGFHKQANALIMRAINEHFVSHVSTMANMTGSKEALEYITDRRTKRCAETDNVCFGLHLNITEGKPISHPDLVPSLITNNGEFLGWSVLVIKAALGLVRKDELARETNAQLTLLENAGAKLVFLNSHHHVHFWWSIARAVVPVAKRHGVKFVRHPKYFWWPALRQKYGIKAVVMGISGLFSGPFTTRLADNFVDFDWVEPTDKARLKALTLVPKNTEFSCHPHVYTAAGDPNTKPICSLEWLLEHRALLEPNSKIKYQRSK